MGLFRNRSPGKTARTVDSNTVGVIIPQSGERFIPVGYHGLLETPEVYAAVNRISDMISSLPIHMRRNGVDGDVRVDDELSRLVDIQPWFGATRQLLFSWLVQTLVLEGEAFLLPEVAGLRVHNLLPMPGAHSVAGPDKLTYFVAYNGAQIDPSLVLHFRLRADVDRPWRGQPPTVALNSVTDSLLVTAQTKNAYMSSEYKPPIIVSVDADSVELSDPKKRRKFLERYVKPDVPGAPWVIPGGMISVSQVKPLSLTDLAIKDGVELDKKAVASIFGVPGFMVGVGSFNRDEYNTFIRSVLLPICRCIEQELTRQLIVENDRYFRFNTRSLFAYDLQTLADIADEQYVRGLMTGNEVRDWLDLDPKEGLNELVMLENYIPADKLGDQKKLIQEGSSDGNEEDDAEQV